MISIIRMLANNYSIKIIFNPNGLQYLCITYLLLLICTPITAQKQTVISGKVTDLTTNEGISFANLFFKGTSIGTVTDIDGYYSISTDAPKDSLYIIMFGYETKTKAIIKQKNQTINFELKPSSLNLKTVEIIPGENPSLRIVKKTIENKEKYNRDQLTSVQYLSYTKQQVDVDNISEKLRRRKFFNPINHLWNKLDSQIVTKEETKKLPVSMSEIVAEIYSYKEAKKKHEEVKAVKINFVGMKDGTAISKLVGTDFQSYNFNNNNVLILEKDFLSPIASNAMLFYNYYLTDSLFIDNIKCYHIEVKPKNKKDLAFTGSIWITDSTFALKQLDLEITKDVNFNLVDYVHIQQQLIPTNANAWVPSQTKVTIDYTNITKKLVSAVIQTYNINRNYIVNEPKQKNFYDTRILFAEDAISKDSSYWTSERPTPITPYEEKTYKIIDTIRRIPFVKKSVDVVYFLFSGYKDIGPLDFGHYMQLYGYNNYEGDRLRIGMRTNEKFSENWIARGYLAYGFKDNEFKYNVQLEKIFTRYPWSKGGIQYRYDIDQIGVNNDFTRTMNLSQPPNYLYGMFSQIGNVKKLLFKEEYRMWYEKEFSQGINTKITFQNIHHTPLFSVIVGDPLSAFQINKYSITELALDARISAKERYIQNGNNRISMGNKRSPIISFNYTQGIKGLFMGDYTYGKASISASNYFRMATLGYSKVLAKAGKVFAKIPYTSLEIPRGNETFFYTENVFNQMNFFEFVSDQYVALFWQHHFMGLIFNRIPVVKKLNLRETIGFHTIYGNLSNVNKAYNSSNVFTIMNNKPYCEASVGVENILDIIQLHFIYRLTYIDSSYKSTYSFNNPENSISNWGIKLGLKFSF
jgi:hypothetical protein